MLFSGACGGDLCQLAPSWGFAKCLNWDFNCENMTCYMTLRVRMHWWELFVLACTLWLMCSAEVFALCHPHLLFGKRSRWGMPYNFWLTYWDVCVSLFMCLAQDIRVRGLSWWCTKNKIKFGFDCRSVRRLTSWTFTHHHLQLLSTIKWLIGCSVLSVRSHRFVVDLP